MSGKIQNNLTIIEMPDASSLNNLEKKRDEELKKIYKLELLLSLAKSAPIKQFQIAETNNLEKTLKIIAIENYLKLGDMSTLLGLNNCQEIDLLYTERKALREYIINELPKKILPIINYVKDLQNDYPEIFKPEQKQLEIIALETKRQELYTKLLRLKNQKCELLKSCANLKVAPYLKNELKIMLSNYKLNHIKANALQGVLLNEFTSRTEHATKAIKEIKKHIDTELEE